MVRFTEDDDISNYSLEEILVYCIWVCMYEYTEECTVHVYYSILNWSMFAELLYLHPLEEV